MDKSRVAGLADKGRSSIKLKYDIISITTLDNYKHYWNLKIHLLIVFIQVSWNLKASWM